MEFGYSHDTSGLQDTYEILSYAARARSRALGVQPVSGFSSSRNSTNLEDFGYDDSHYSHSRQFRSNIIDEQSYWNRIKEICNGFPSGN